MSAVTLYDASVGQAKLALASLSNIMAKIEASPVADTIANSSIHEDMKPFSFQVHFVAVLIIKMVSRLSGTEPPELDYDAEALSTLDGLRKRIAEAEAAAEAADAETINARQSEIVPLGLGPNKPMAHLPAWAYLQGYAQPNIFFHLTTAYDIARMEGVPLGKLDFIRPFLAEHVKQ